MFLLIVWNCEERNILQVVYFIKFSVQVGFRPATVAESAYGDRLL